jgi:hypothetical protein
MSDMWSVGYIKSYAKMSVDIIKFACSNLEQVQLLAGHDLHFFTLHVVTFIYLKPTHALL